MIRVDSLHDTMRLTCREIVRNKWALVVPFAGICTLAVLLGFTWPTSYASSVTIHVEDNNIIDLLMEGRVVRPEVTGLVSNAREVIYKRSLMLEALEVTGRTENATAAKNENLVTDMRKRTTVSDPGKNLIRIEYRDVDPQIVHQVTERLGQLFIQRMMESKQQESKAAYQFIDFQVQRYDQEFARIQTKLKDIRKENQFAEPGALDEINRRKVELSGQIDDLEQQLREAKIREQSLREQLSGEAESGAAVTRTQQYRSRIADLQSRLETLRLQYRDSYPDIVEIKQKIEDLGSSLKQAQSEQKGEQGSAESDAWQNNNTVSQELRQNLYNVRTEARTLQARLEHVSREFEESKQKVSRLQDVQGRIERFQRDYEVTRNMYEDLLQRRENARVSMDLDSEQEGHPIRVQEPAFVPHRPAGPQFVHFVVAGGFFAIALPMGFLLSWLNFDARVRHPDHLPAEAREVLLGTLARAVSPANRRRTWLGLTLAIVVVIAVLAALGGLAWLNLTERLEDMTQVPWWQWLDAIGIPHGA